MKKKLPFKFIAIEGNIGAGKTTLAEYISKATGAKLLLERFNENPYLKDFYRNKEQFALDTENFFFQDRLQQLKSFFNDEQILVVADYTIYKSHIFSQLNLNSPYNDIFKIQFNESVKELRAPDLIIHLKTRPENLKSRIIDRGRDYEKEISENYLHSIENAYSEYWKQQDQLNILEIDPSELDFPYKNEQIAVLLDYLETSEIKGFNRFKQLSNGE